MNSIDIFLVQYGLAAIFLLMFAKSVGVPIPIPADLIVLTAAASVTAGKLVLWQAFGVILLAVVFGGLIQFVLVRSWSYPTLPFWSLYWPHAGTPGCGC